MLSEQNKENMYKSEQQFDPHFKGASIQPFTTRNNNQRQSAAFRIKSMCGETQSTEQKISFPIRSSELPPTTCKADPTHNKENMYISEINELKKKLEESYKSQHKVDNIIEEYQVSIQKQEEQLLQCKKKVHDLQSKCTASEDKIKSQQESISQLEKEKKVISDKWVRLSSRISVEGKHKQKSEEYKQTLETVEEQQRKSANKISELQNTICSLRNQLKHQEAIINDYQVRFKQLQIDKIRLSEDNSSLYELSNRNKILEAQLQLCKEENAQLLEDRLKVETTSRENNQKLQEDLVEARDKLQANIDRVSMLENENKELTNRLRSMENDQVNQGSDQSMNVLQTIKEKAEANSIGDDDCNYAQFKSVNMTQHEESAHSAHRSGSYSKVNITSDGWVQNVQTCKFQQKHPVNSTRSMKVISFPPRHDNKGNKNPKLNSNVPTAKVRDISAVYTNKIMSFDMGDRSTKTVFKNNRSERNLFDIGNDKKLVNE